MTKYFTNIVKLYSTAFFEYARERKIVSRLSEDFTKLKELFLQNSSAIENISAPIYSREEQINLLASVIKDLKLSKEMENFTYVLLENKRLSLLPLISAYFNVLVNEYLGNKIVEVTLSDAVSSKEQDKIKNQLEDIFSSKVDLSFKEDENIIAGIIIKTDNKMFDASLKTKFTNLTDSVSKKIALL